MKRFLFSLFALAVLCLPASASDGMAGPVQNMLALAGMAVVAWSVAPAALRALGVSLPMLGLLMATTINATALNTAFGAQYTGESKSFRELRQVLYESAEFDKLFTVDYTDLTVWKRGTSSLSSFVQRYQLPFTPNGTLTLQPSEIPLYDIKGDTELSSHDIKRSFIGHAHRNNIPQTSQAFLKWLVTEHLGQKFTEDIELLACWRGVQEAVVSGTAGTGIGAMNGLRWVINDHITEGRIVPIHPGAGALTGAVDFVNYVEAFVAQVPNVVVRKPMKLAMNLTKERLFKEGMRLKYNENYRQVEDILRVNTQPNIEVVGLAAMGTTPKIWMTPMENAIKAVNLNDNPIWQFENKDRTVKVWTDQAMGYGFWIPGYVFTNDVDLEEEEVS